MAELPRLVLASGSPRRRELLAGLGLRFEVRPAAIDERAAPGEAPADLVRRVAAEKARAVGARGELVIGADTVVVVDDAVLGKPADAAAARAMLARLSGRRHEVLTGVAVQEGERRVASVERTRVWMAALSAEEIDWSVATGEPLDKAGAYAIQGLAALFVERIEGNYGTVVGLPLAATQGLVRRLGYDLRSWRQAGPVPAGPSGP